MNVAASSLLILWLLLPAVAFRRGYYSGAFSKQYFTEGFGALILRAFLLAVVLHTAAFATLWITGVGLADSYPAVLAYVFGDGRSALIQVVPRAWPLLAFTGGLIPFGAVAGYLAHRVVRRGRFDRRFKSLRFRNYWHYVLRGEIREFAHAKALFASGRKVIGYTFIDALAATSEGDVIYDGILVDYELGPDNGIQFLVLTGTRRRHLRADRPEGEPLGEEGAIPEDAVYAVSASDLRYYDVYGDLFVLPGATIKNYNIRYIDAIDAVRATSVTDANVVTLRDADGDTNSARYYNDRPS